jgi:hypothetical protein
MNNNYYPFGNDNEGFVPSIVHQTHKGFSLKEMIRNHAVSLL